MTQYVYKHEFGDTGECRHTVYAVADCPVKAAILAQAFALSGGLAWKRFKQTIVNNAGKFYVHMQPTAWADPMAAPYGVRNHAIARSDNRSSRAGEYIVEDGTARYEDKGMEAGLAAAERDRVALSVWYSLTEHERFHAKSLAIQCSGVGELDSRATMSITLASGCNVLAVISFSSSKYERCMSLFVTYAKERGVNVRRGESAGLLLANWAALAEAGVFGSHYRELYRAALAAQSA